MEKKVDLAFYNKSALNGKNVNDHPSTIGYGVSERPQPGEFNQPKICHDKGFWKYNILEELIPQNSKKDFIFDAKRTKELIRLLTRQKKVKRIFLEPHLVNRLHLRKHKKIKYHGCQAVRHDDHIHLGSVLIYKLTSICH